MPHRRRKKKEADTKLIFNSDTSVLYLSVLSLSEEEDTLRVPLDTFLVLSVLRYAGAERQFKVRFVVREEEDGDARACLPVSVRRDSVGGCVAPVDAVPKPVSCCRSFFFYQIFGPGLYIYNLNTDPNIFLEFNLIMHQK